MVHGNLMQTRIQRGQIGQASIGCRATIFIMKFQKLAWKLLASTQMAITLMTSMVMDTQMQFSTLAVEGTMHKTSWGLSKTQVTTCSSAVEREAQHQLSWSCSTTLTTS